jgi:hypothetical protein
MALIRGPIRCAVAPCWSAATSGCCPRAFRPHFRHRQTCTRNRLTSGSGAACISVTDTSSGSSRSSRPPQKAQRVSSTGTSTGAALLALVAGLWRRENAPCPGLRPGRFGFFFRSPLENGAALIVAAEFLVLLSQVLDLPLQLQDQADQIVSAEGIQLWHTTLWAGSVCTSTALKSGYGLLHD